MGVFGWVGVGVAVLGLVLLLLGLFRIGDGPRQMPGAPPPPGTRSSPLPLINTIVGGVLLLVGIVLVVLALTGVLSGSSSRSRSDRDEPRYERDRNSDDRGSDRSSDRSDDGSDRVDIDVNDTASRGIDMQYLGGRWCDDVGGAMDFSGSGQMEITLGPNSGPPHYASFSLSGSELTMTDTYSGETKRAHLERIDYNRMVMSAPGQGQETVHRC